MFIIWHFVDIVQLLYLLIYCGSFLEFYVKDMFINIKHNCAFQENSIWITFVYLNFRHWNFSHRRKPWLRKYLLHRHLQIVIQWKVMLKNNRVYFLAICANFPCKIEKFELEVVGVGILGTGFCFQGQPLTYSIGKSQLKE